MSSTSSSPTPHDDDGQQRRSRSSSPASGLIRVMKTQLNFFMTRLLFMEGDNAENSLQAQLNNKKEVEERYVEVIPDNAKILPNAVAKSMPPLLPPPAAPPSPRSIEGKAGLLQIRLLQAQSSNNGNNNSTRKVVDPTSSGTTSTTVSDDEDEDEQQQPVATKKNGTMIRENSVKHFPQNTRRLSTRGAKHVSNRQLNASSTHSTKSVGEKKNGESEVASN